MAMGGESARGDFIVDTAGISRSMPPGILGGVKSKTNELQA